MTDITDAFKTGFVAIVGRPNVGKSTLLNALVGQKISITADKPQTTRHRIHGLVTSEQAQIILVDTPGYQTRYSGSLNRLMNKAVVTALADVDCVVMVIEALRLSAEDRQVAELLPEKVPVLLAISKCDLVKPRDRLLPFMQEVSTLFPFTAIIPLSAKKADQLDTLLQQIRTHIPIGPPLYDPDDITDRDFRFLCAEIIREKVFRLVGDELPYRSTVVIDQFERAERLHRVFATIFVDADAHKPMLIGASGERIKRIASEARVDMERLLDTKVHLEVWIKVRGGWADSDANLRAHGYE